MFNSIKKHALKLAMAISLLLHVLVFVILGLGLDWLQFLQPALAQPQAEKEPIVFTFTEAPESARIEKPNPEAKYASDKNAQAQNPDAPKDLPLGEAYSNGAIAAAEALPQLKSQPSSPQAFQNPSSSTSKNIEEPKEESQDPSSTGMSRPQPNYSASSFRREFLTGQSSAPPSAESSPGRDQTQTRAPQFGSFSLNTYNWDFAPYLLWLKKRIQSNIYPPPAFTHMGLISGQTRLRFRIRRDGTLQGPELMEYNGHVSLMQTSMRAVEVSVPFKKLPDDFPEEYLEVTAQFEYTILRPNSP